jgi:hypothetical protein
MAMLVRGTRDYCRKTTRFFDAALLVLAQCSSELTIGADACSSSRAGVSGGRVVSA